MPKEFYVYELYISDEDQPFYVAKSKLVTLTFKSAEATGKHFGVSGPTIQQRLKNKVKKPFIYDNVTWAFHYEDTI